MGIIGGPELKMKRLSEQRLSFCEARPPKQRQENEAPGCKAMPFQARCDAALVPPCLPETLSE